MELLNECYARCATRRAPATLRFALATAASLMFPFAPHVCADVYERLTGERVWEEPWPDADPALLERDVVRARLPGQRQAARPRAGAVDAHARGARASWPRSAERPGAPRRQGDRQGDRRAGQARQPGGPRGARLLGVAEGDLDVLLVAALLGARERLERPMVGVEHRRGEQAARREAPGEDGVQLGRQHDEARAEVEPRDQADDGGERAVRLARAPHHVRDVDAAERLQGRPQDLADRMPGRSRASGSTVGQQPEDRDEQQGVDGERQEQPADHRPVPAEPAAGEARHSGRQDLPSRPRATSTPRPRTRVMKKSGRRLWGMA